MHKYIFLNYRNRSGSTLLASLLNTSNHICSCPEADILYNLLLKNSPHCQISSNTIKQLGRAFNSDPKLHFWCLSLSDLDINLNSVVTKEDVFFSVLRAYCKKNKPNSKFILFKGSTIEYCLRRCTGKIVNLNNDLFFLFLLRDPRASFESQKRSKSISGFSMDNSPRHSAQKWLYFAKITGKCRRKNKNTYIVKYEDLIVDTYLALKNIGDFLETDISLASDSHDNHSYYEVIPNNQKKLHNGILLAPNIYKINLWKDVLNKPEILLIELFSRKRMKNFGYCPLSPKPNFVHFLSIFFISEIKSLFSRFITLSKRVIKYPRLFS